MEDGLIPPTLPSTKSAALWYPRPMSHPHHYVFPTSNGNGRSAYATGVCCRCGARVRCANSFEVAAGRVEIRIPASSRGSRLTSAQLEEIRGAWPSVGQQELARRYGISQAYVSKIVRSK